MKKQSDVKAPWVKIGLLSLLIAGAGVFVWANFVRTERGLSTPEQRAQQFQPGEGRGQTGERPSGRQEGWVDPRTDPESSREERQAERMERLGLTSQQREQMEQLRAEIHTDPNAERGAMFEAMREVLTPEQADRWGQQGGQQSEQFRAERDARRAAREQEAREALSPQEFREWLAIREERRATNMQEGTGRGPQPGQGAARAGTRN